MTRTVLILGLLLSIFRITFSQVQLDWAARYNGPANDSDAALAIAVDDSGNVYVTGASPGIGTDRDYATSKYNSQGHTVWIRRFNGPENGFDVARDIVVDNSGNVYITGTSVSATIKYDRFGNQVWLRRYGQFSGGYRLLLDSSNNVIIAGESLFDFMTLKYSNEGSLMWAAAYNGPANYNDRINDLALDTQGNVIVAGESWGVGTQWDYLTIKYSPGGDTLWARRYNGPAPPQEVPSDFALGIATDDSANVYVTGWSDGVDGTPQCLTIKYSPTGATVWERRFPASGTIGYVGYDILYDPSGFTYVATRAGGFDDTLLKYDRAGNLVWSAQYVASHTFATNRPRLARDRLGNIYATSSTYVAPHAYYVVLKYGPDGVRRWEFRYRPPGNWSFTTSNAYGLCVDSLLNVYVTGESYTPSTTGYDYLTLKISQGSTDAGRDRESLPSRFELHQNYPNPFNPETNIRFAIPTTTRVQLEVFDILGRRVRTLVSEQLQAGEHTRMWDGLNDAGANVASGIYLYRLHAGNYNQTRKLLLLK